MKVVVTHLDFTLYWPARLRALHSVLREKDHELHAIDVASKGSPYEFARKNTVPQNGNVSRVTLFADEDLRSLPASRVSQRLTAALEELQPDVVVACPIAFTPGATAVRWCRENRRGVVIMDDARIEDVPRNRLTNTIKRRVYANVDAMLVPAPSHRTTCEFFGIDTSRVFFGVDVIDNDWFSERAEITRGSNFRNIRGNPLPAKYFLGVGRQVPKKNWATLLAAYNAYRQRAAEPWDLVLVGEGTDRAALEKQVQTNSMAGVHFLPFLTAEELAVVYAAAQCLVLASFYGETWGLVVNEAMACGLPVLVSSECGCAQTLVENDHNGWTFSPYHVGELLEVMTRMAAQSTHQLAAMRAYSRQIIDTWGLSRFAEGASAAIEACRAVRRGFARPWDRAIMRSWKGRYRPT